jgi:hypothetical protein
MSAEGIEVLHMGHNEIDFGVEPQLLTALLESCIDTLVIRGNRMDLEAMELYTKSRGMDMEELIEFELV